jgi:spermidine/putrescine transport system permease protein
MVLVAFLYVPLLLLVLFSFNDSRTLTFPLSGFTLAWYGELFNTPELLTAAWNSVILGVTSSAIATVIGAMAAIGLIRFRFAGRNVFIAIAMMPLVIPSVVMGVAMLIGFSQINLSLSLWTVGIGHVVLSIPIVILIMMARLSGLNVHLEEAAMDLGATYLGAQVRVTLPALVASFLTAFTTSFDEFALSYFLVGVEPTLPIYLYSQLRFPARLPVVVAMASVIIVTSFLIILFSDWLRRIGQEQPSPAAAAAKERHERPTLAQRLSGRSLNQTAATRGGDR